MKMFPSFFMQKPCSSKGESSNFARETSKKKNLNIRKDVNLDSTFTVSYVPKEFVQAVKPFYDHAVIEDFWKSVYLGTKAISYVVNKKP
ncbi:hypothetical protein AM233_25940 [Bacillus sp. FJAT-22058]|nr:hypothetical protein AM233_25940 [Bacillus sp. FJAT-22058]